MNLPKLNLVEKLKVLGVGLVMAVLVGFLGCAGFQDALTPCYIDREIGEYAEDDMTSFVPFTSLFDAKRLKRRMDYVHEMNQEQISRLHVDDIMVYSFLNDSITIGMKDSSQLQETIFSPSGPLGLLIPTLLGGTLGATLISKPSDRKKIVELQNGKTV